MKILFQLILVALIFWLIGFSQFNRYANSLINADNLQKVQANVVLTGDDLRIKEGFSLLKQNTAPKLFISGVGSGVQIEELALENNFDIKQIPNYNQKIILGRVAKTTKQNGVEVGEWLKTEKITSIRLITSSYHMPRSLLEIQRNAKGVKIIPHPIVTANKKEDLYLLKEYNKFIIVSLINFLGL
jgi:uncharacterized SAM-binding protein YcdF (DUF218 family)